MRDRRCVRLSNWLRLSLPSPLRHPSGAFCILHAHFAFREYSAATCARADKFSVNNVGMRDRRSTVPPSASFCFTSVSLALASGRACSGGKASAALQSKDGQEAQALRSVMLMYLSMFRCGCRE